MLNYSTKHQRTRVIPLRWIGNVFGEFAADHLMAAAYMDEDNSYGFKYKYHGFLWKYLNKPWEWWGTYYTIDLDLMEKAWENIDE